MLQWQNNKIIVSGCFVILTLAGGIGLYHSQSPVRAPAGASIVDFSVDQLARAEWSVSSQDFQDSDPGRGRSYFDYVFSQLVKEERVYEVPYPFEKVLERVDRYLGYENSNEADSSLRVTLFPMGRSLQRNAALIGSSEKDISLFFRYPRVVVGVDKEPKVPFALNLKGRLFLGFNERSKVIEAISYNDQEGRYEYQIVRDYEPGKTPKVVYANRQLCLSCHQNQTPIFSSGPWGESNAHPEIYSAIESQLDPLQRKKSGRTTPKYFGAPTRVDLSVPYALDVLVDKGNLYPALNKLWLEVCTTLECKQKTMKLILRYLLTGQEGLQMSSEDKSDYLLNFEKNFKKRFPFGMKIPDPKIPNREPLRDRKKSQAEIEQSINHVGAVIRDSLQELIMRSSVSGELEPLMVRQARELWLSSEPDERNTNRLILGYSEFFTALDLKQIESWLEKGRIGNAGSGLLDLQTHCQIEKIPQGSDFVVQIYCPSSETPSLALQSGYFQIRQNKVQQGVIENLFFYGARPDCDRRAVQSLENRVNGVACPALPQAEVSGNLKGDVLDLQLFQSNTGLKSRLLDGRLVSRVQIDLKTGALKASIVNDIAVLDQIIDRLPNTLFSRKLVLKTLAEGFGVPFEDPDVDGKMGSLEKNVETEAFSAKQILTKYQNPVDTFSHSCGMCHYNLEGVPPAFLGIKPGMTDPFEKCQRIEICAPQILYRLKMRNCSSSQIAQFQKNPMPLPHFFEMTKVDVQSWQKNIAPQLIQFALSLVRPSSLESYMISQGVGVEQAHQAVLELTTKDCPNVDYKVYENLPRCSFSQLKLDSQCSKVMSAF